MDCLVNLLGTTFDHVAEFNERYQNEKIIWFMEACDLNLMSIRRAIWQMKNAGWFQNLAGFLIGRPLCFGEEAFGIDQYRAVTDLLAEYGVPVIMDMDIGHLPPMMPLIVGATAAVDVKGNEVSITYTWK
jgi:muramoyltetrapeptide carboxypeptidase LdcA involved in peptidoglycan recycling